MAKNKVSPYRESSTDGNVHRSSRSRETNGFRGDLALIGGLTLLGTAFVAYKLAASIGLV
jgi:hypothetical protein